MIKFDTKKYETKYNIDRKNHPDSEVIDFMGRKMLLGDIRNNYAKFDERKYKMISFFDDIYQYTTLGLFDVICDKFNLDEDIPVDDFFKRTEMNGNIFIYNKLHKKYPQITLEVISEIEENNYGEILLRSPLSKNFKSLFKMREILDSQMVVFKYKFNGCGELLRAISDKFDHGDYASIEPVFLNGLSEKEFYNSLPKSKYNYIDLVACNDARSLIDFTLDKKIEDTIILTSLNHDGIDDEEKAMYEMLEGVGPNNARIYYISEEI